MMAAWSCSSDKDSSEPILVPDSEPKDLITSSSSVFIQISGTGEGTAASPFKSSVDTPAIIALMLPSSYADPDGSTYTCEPKATIQVTTTHAKVKAKTIAELTDLKDSTKSDSKGTDPLVKHMEQTFTLGGQTITFDLTTEIYTHTDNRNRTFEMPYTQLSAAKYGAAQAEETRSDSRDSRHIAITGIRLVPVAQTRGSITTEQTYRVSVAFTVDAEVENSKEQNRQTLSFLAEYDAIVEATTEYPDPVTTFSYRAEAVSGSESTRSPFELTEGMTQMQVDLQQQAAYTWFSVGEMETKVLSFKPKAQITVALSDLDTLWVANKEELEQFVAGNAVIAENGSSPQVVTGQKTFSIAGKDITVSWSYDTYAAINAEGSDVAVPYLELSEPQVVSVQATELPNVTIPGKQAKVYEVEMRLSQVLKSVNTPEEQSETIEYVIKSIGVFEVKLVKVVYRKDWEWIDSHDNMVLAYYPMVHHDRIYFTGETFTDTFRDAGHIPGEHIGFIFGGKAVQEVSDGILIRTFWPGDNRDSILITFFSASVPDLSKVSDVFEYEGEVPDYQYVTLPRSVE